MEKPAGAIGIAIVLIIFCSLLPISSVRAQEEAFYKGKTIKVLVGTTAGSLYDLWARTIAAHIGKHIPGDPETLAQNMPGAGHKIATNYLYNVAKPDGLTIIGSILPGVYIDQLVGRPAWRVDPYSTPLDGMYLCSSSTPPGGGVHGMCGFLAARSALKRMA